MIVGIGVDLVDIDRIRHLLSRFPVRARARLFTEAEIEYCEARGRPVESYAVRFAAKEAFFKAIGTGWSDGTSWKDVEILRDGAAPFLKLNADTARLLAARGVDRTHVSLTHTESTACAIVILEKEEGWK